MTIAAKKSKLIELIQKTDDDKAIIFALELFGVSEDAPVESWNDTPDEVRTGIKEAIKQADEGKLTPHKEVIAMFREKYKR